MNLIWGYLCKRTMISSYPSRNASDVAMSGSGLASLRDLYYDVWFRSTGNNQSHRSKNWHFWNRWKFLMNVQTLLGCRSMNYVAGPIIQAWFSSMLYIPTISLPWVSVVRISFLPPNFILHASSLCAGKIFCIINDDSIVHSLTSLLRPVKSCLVFSA